MMNQIDYITINEIKKCRTYPRTDCAGEDHVPVTANMEMKLTKNSERFKSQNDNKIVTVVYGSHVENNAIYKCKNI